MAPRSRPARDARAAGRGRQDAASANSPAASAALACVAKNSRSPLAARHGDGKAIGLLAMMDAVTSLLDGQVIGDCTWNVTGGDFMHDDVLYKAGVYVGVIRIETAAPLATEPALDIDGLPDFLSMYADYDLPPDAGSTEHDKWLSEPPDHGTSKPELSDQLQLQQP